MPLSTARRSTLERMLSMATTRALEPEPIPLDVKVVLVGERSLYYLLAELDPEFRLMRGAANVMLGRVNDAQSDLTSAALNDNLSAALWRGYAAYIKQDWQTARRELERGAGAMEAVSALAEELSLDELNALLRSRVRDYSRCELTIDTSDKSLEQVVAIEGIREVYATGQGGIRLRGKARTSPLTRSKCSAILTPLTTSSRLDQRCVSESKAQLSVSTSVSAATACRSVSQPAPAARLLARNRRRETAGR